MNERNDDRLFALACFIYIGLTVGLATLLTSL
jgi:hypothetical protein